MPAVSDLLRHYNELEDNLDEGIWDFFKDFLPKLRPDAIKPILEYFYEKNADKLRTESNMQSMPITFFDAIVNEKLNSDIFLRFTPFSHDQKDEVV